MLKAAAEQRMAEFTGAKPKFTGGTPETINAKLIGDREGVLRLLPHAARRFTPEHRDDTADAEQQRRVHELLPVRADRDDLAAAGAVHHRRQAHSIEFSEDAYKRAAEPKELFIVPNAGHVDLYDRVNLIPFDKLAEFFRGNLS